MNLRFPCPVCATTVRVELPGSGEWQCPGCDHLGQLQAPPRAATFEHCSVCGNAELYKQKDFPHWLGLSLLMAACVPYFVASLLYHQWWAWAFLIGFALIDGILYLCVGDVIVCYRCDAHHRGLPPHPGHRPFELTVQERYRQERLRRELATNAARHRTM